MLQAKTRRYLIALNVLFALIIGLTVASPAFADVDEGEGNNSFETATQTAMDVVTKGTIVDADAKYSKGGVSGEDSVDIDYYKLEVPEAGKYVFDFTNDTRNDRAMFGNEYDVAIFDGDYVSKYKIDVTAYDTKTNSKLIELSAGTHYVKVREDLWTSGINDGTKYHFILYTYTDVDLDVAHFDDIAWTTANGISKGWTMDDKTKEFRPLESVARCDMAAFLHRLYNKWTGGVDLMPTKEAVGSVFVDVDADTPHAEDIWWLAQTGISQGWTLDNGKREFRPYEPVKRQDMAAFLFRMAKGTNKGGASDTWTADESARSKFRDVSATATDNHHDEVWWLASTGISTGWDVGGKQSEFRGLQNVARADMAAFLHRLDGIG